MKLCVAVAVLLGVLGTAWGANGMGAQELERKNIHLRSGIFNVDPQNIRYVGGCWMDAA